MTVMHSKSAAGEFSRTLLVLCCVGLVVPTPSRTQPADGSLANGSASSLPSVEDRSATEVSPPKKGKTALEEGTEASLEEAPDHGPLYFILSLEFASKNLSAGLSLRYLDYLQTTASTDFVLTTLLTGFSLDDLTAVRLSFSQALAARLSLTPLTIAPWHGQQQLLSPYPDIAFGLGAYFLAEVDSLAQYFRLSHPGLFWAFSLGPFVSFIFRDFSLTLLYRPFGQTAYYVDGTWDSTQFQLRNASLDVNFTYTFPW